MSKGLNWKTWLGDYRFWIVLFFIVRLYGITNPPLEVAHSWRQATVNMAARNFLEVDNNILYPRMDMAGERTGITGMEFPLLNYLIYLASAIFGYEHWYGRLINLILSSIGIFFFGKTITRYFSKTIALNAVLILLSSIWFSYARKSMPDTFSISLVMVGLYYGLEYLYQKGNIKNLLLFFIFTLFGVLSKVPSLYACGILVLPFFSKSVATPKKIGITVAMCFTLTTTGWWYFYWVPYLNETYGYVGFFMGKSMSTGIVELFQHFGEVAQHFYFDAIHLSGFLLFVLGLSVAIYRKEKKPLLVFIVLFLPFLGFMAKSGDYFSHHIYYIIPFVPAMALIAGYGISTISNRYIAIGALVVTTIVSASNYQHDFFLKEKRMYLLTLESLMDEQVEKEALIAVNGGLTPLHNYFTHRKGWQLTHQQLVDGKTIPRIKNLGCNYLIIDKQLLESTLSFPELQLQFENDYFLIYKF